jgi:hypothetical protein
MNTARLVAIVVGLIVGAQAASAQDTSRYRTYVLESTLESILAASGARAADTKTLHGRPAKIQELEWRAPYTRSGTELPDPVRNIIFTFYNDALYQVVVNYDGDRTEGLTDSDVIESISAVYGIPALGTTRTGPGSQGLTDAAVLARWESAASLLTLVHRAYATEFQLTLVSKPLAARARAAITEAIRLDTIEAPRREAERRKQNATDATAARDKVRIANKAAFRP